VVDLVEEGFDFAVRLARLSNLSRVSRPLTSTCLVDSRGQPTKLPYGKLSEGDQRALTGAEGGTEGVI
jgi:hypothetical protein